jgi:hypothetical protein
MARRKPKSIVRSFSAPEKEIEMLEAVAHYHGLSKSGAIRALIRKEFWRIFPAGTNSIRPEEGARIVGGQDGGE